MIKISLLIVITVIAFACNKTTVIDECEKEWLKNHPDLNIGISTNQPPYEFINEKGQLDGMFINFLTIIEDRLGYEFKKIFQPDWLRLLSDAKDGKVDVVLEIQETNERKEFLNFTPFLLSHKHVIVVKKTREDITSISNLTDKKIAVVNTYAVQEYLFKNYPGYSVIPFFDNVIGLRAVSTGQADAFIGQQAVVTYYIETEGISNLKIAGEIDYPNELAIASRKDLDTLNIILSKAVNSITKTEKQTIYNRWLSYEVKPFYAEVKFWIVILVVILVVLAFVIFFNLALRKRVKQKTKELTNAKEKVEKNEERYRSLMLNLETGIVVYTPDTSILMNNSKASEMLGMSDHQMKGKSATDPEWVFVTENNTPLPLNEYPASQIANDKKPIRNQVLGIHQSGNSDVVWALINGFSELNDKGEITEIIVSFMDITERKKAEQRALDSQVELNKALELSNQSRQTLLSVLEDQREVEKEIQKLNKELEQRVIERTAQLEASNKELEAFSYSVSHDLRAPLRHINGFAEILISEYSGEMSDEARRNLNTIISSAKKMGILIDDLLSLSRTGRTELKKTSISMQLIVKDALKQIAPAIKDRNIEWKISPLPEVYGDYNLLRLAWVNLLDNAVKYTTPKNIAKINIGYKIEKNMFVFHINDNGVGFDMKYSQKLFGVFQRLHSTSQFEGTGIGLANVRRIIGRHGGNTWAEAEPGKGATFYFSIPMA